MSQKPQDVTDDREEQRRYFKRLEFENHGDNVLEKSTSEECQEERPIQRKSDRNMYEPENEEEVDEAEYVPWSKVLDHDYWASRGMAAAAPNFPPKPYPPTEPSQEARNSYDELDRERLDRPRPRPRRNHDDDMNRQMMEMNMNDNASFGNSIPYKPKINMKPEPYDGKEDFDSYIQRFETCAFLGRWNDREKSMVLATMLNGSARTFLQTLTERERKHYNVLKSRLETRFGSASKHGQYWVNQFNERMRHTNETISSFADEILLLANKAYPLDMSQRNLNQVALQQIYKSLEPDTRWKCIEKKCETVAEAVEIIETYEAFSKGMGKKNARQVSTSDERDSIDELFCRIRTLESKSDPPNESERKRKLEPRDPDSFKQCYGCGKYGHIYKHCPTITERRNQHPRSASKKSEN